MPFNTLVQHCSTFVGQQMLQDVEPCIIGLRNDDGYGNENAKCSNIKHLMTGPEGNSSFCFPRISMFPRGVAEGNIKIRATTTAVVGQHFAGNSALLPSDVIDFALLPAQRLLAGNSFIVRCHVTSK